MSTGVYVQGISPLGTHLLLAFVAHEVYRSVTLDNTNIFPIKTSTVMYKSSHYSTFSPTLVLSEL